MSKGCARHPDRPAAATCGRCRGAACAACVLMTPLGSFCSPECAAQARAFRERAREAPARRPGETLRATAGVVLAALAAVVLLHLAARLGVPGADRADIIGRLLRSVERSGELRTR
ncbi:MAG TPA: hypothetical protein VNO22_12815 [Planctomycetota bacterium]|nr:hypothetical protein [Planctomycetota bacterium]